MDVHIDGTGKHGIPPAGDLVVSGEFCPGVDDIPVPDRDIGHPPVREEHVTKYKVTGWIGHRSHGLLLREAQNSDREALVPDRAELPGSPCTEGD
ncbi:hypothetical protein ASZ90_016684 [hydrocarbon metagenome]|uniref:Uncharacterized protein n=1 Tax=hydrocarbon metagenome TaxID=938273 RepID=A0A0W8EGV2_9ZZZZ